MTTGPAEASARRLPPVVDVAWLERHRDDVVVADVRWYLDGRSGQAAYDAGHVPGAVFVDLDRWLAAPPTPAEGRHPLPSPDVFAQGLSQAGIGDATTVVAYDDAGGATASCLVWMLRVLGRSAAVLDGGLQAWAGPLETGTRPVPPAHVTPRPWPTDRLADLSEVTSRAPGTVLVDARDRARYRGEVEPVDPRPGHVPGAVNVPFRELLGEDGRFLPPHVLREHLADAGIRAGRDVVVYCGSGVTACHDLIALEHAGLEGGRLFAGSWSQYSGRPELPAALGDE